MPLKHLVLKALYCHNLGNGFPDIFNPCFQVRLPIFFGAFLYPVFDSLPFVSLRNLCLYKDGLICDLATVGDLHLHIIRYRNTHLCITRG